MQKLYSVSESVAINVSTNHDAGSGFDGRNNAGYSVVLLGYDVQVSADASASWSKYGDDLALRRMENAGAAITTVDQIIAELAIDWTSPNGQKLRAILDYR